MIVVILGLGIGSYFVFFGEKCAKDELFNPYSETCEGKNVVCNIGMDCTLLEGQPVSVSGESLTFMLVSAKEESRGDSALIKINGVEVPLTNYGESNIDVGDYKIFFESADGDSDKIMGASFEIAKV